MTKKLSHFSFDGNQSLWGRLKASICCENPLLNHLVWDKFFSEKVSEVSYDEKSK